MAKLTIVKCPLVGPVAVEEIENTLEALQAAVGGGYIEVLPCYRPVERLLLACDEEGRLKKLARNPHIPEILGDAFFVKDAGEDFASLTPEETRTLVAWLADVAADVMPTSV